MRKVPTTALGASYTADSASATPAAATANGTHHSGLEISPAHIPAAIARQAKPANSKNARANMTALGWTERLGVLVSMRSNVEGNQTATLAAKPLPAVADPRWPTCYP